MHQALAYSREAYDYSSDNLRIGAERAGRDWREIDNGAWVVTVVSEDSAAAKRAARILVAFYISSMPPEQLARHGIDASSCSPSSTPSAPGDIPKAVELFRPSTPRSCRSPARRRSAWRRSSGPAARGGQPHDPRALDPSLVKLFSGRTCRTSRTSRASSGSSPSG
jgi:5,10-methylenetetrahydromethanopterin reductase